MNSCNSKSRPKAILVVDKDYFNFYNRTMSVKRKNAILTIIAILAVPLAIILSVSYGVAMGSDEVMENCLFGGTVSFCPMSLFEHLSLWQNMFVANLPKVAVYLFLFLALFGLNLTFSALRLTLSKSYKAIHNQKLYLKQNPDILLFDYLREIFSKGILKPKIYTPNF